MYTDRVHPLAAGAGCYQSEQFLFDGTYFLRCTLHPEDFGTYPPYTYDGAQSACAAEAVELGLGDMRLASLTSAAQAAAVHEQFGGAYMIGGTDSGSEGTWRWTGGACWSYANWTGGAPSDDTSKNCVEVSYDGSWDGADCDTNPLYVLCSSTVTGESTQALSVTSVMHVVYQATGRDNNYALSLGHLCYETNVPMYRHS
jgi:hypothetical protein